MSESFEPDDAIEEFTNRYAEPDYPARPGALVASESVRVFTESDCENLAYRSTLSVGLAQITSRLLRRLATGDEGVLQLGVATAGGVQRDTSGNRVPRDDGPLVTWRRVVAVSAAGSLLALVSLPLQNRSARIQAQIGPT
jgi:hypothetical protein